MIMHTCTASRDEARAEQRVENLHVTIGPDDDPI
jgi:hypothetical protein